MADFRFFDFLDLYVMCNDCVVLQHLIFGEDLSTQWERYKYHDFYYLDPICASIVRDLESVEQLCDYSNTFNREQTRFSVLAQKLFSRYYYCDDDGFNGKYSYLLQEDIEEACYYAGYPKLDFKLIPRQIIYDNGSLASNINAQITGNARFKEVGYRDSLDIRALKQKALIYALCFNAILCNT